MDKLYKIRDKNTGLFSSGGRNPNFTKRGKVWRVGPLKLHLNQMYKIPKNWEIVELEIVESEKFVQNAKEWFAPVVKKHEEEDLKRGILYREQRKIALQQEIDRKTKELENLK